MTNPAFTVGDLNRRTTAERFRYRRCPQCGLVYLAAVPADLGRYYPPDYYPSTAARLDDLAKAAEAHEGYKVRLIAGYKPTGRLLEVGPGGGGFAYLAKRAGYEVSVVEMSEASCRFLAEGVGVRVVRSDDPTAALRADSGRYNVIAAWHVIEHLTDPRGMVEAAADRLAPGGVLVLAAPNPAALQYRLFGRYWVHLDAPRHLSLIPHPVLTRWAEGAGLVTRLVTTTDEGGLAWDRFGWERSVRNVLPARPGRVMRPLARATARVLSGAGRAAEQAKLRGTAYTAVFQKPE